MLYYSVAFAIIAVVAAFCGFSGVTSSGEEIAKLMFFIFLSIALISIAADIFYFS
jgi:uncharacterized membrane protein YtjA (UPF0391 family)